MNTMVEVDLDHPRPAKSGNMKHFMEPTEGNFGGGHHVHNGPSRL